MTLAFFVQDVESQGRFARARQSGQNHKPVLGDGNGDITNTIIQVDEPAFRDESIRKLTRALNCLKEINKNKKLYYLPATTNSEKLPKGE